MKLPTTIRPSLVRIITWRLAITSVLAMLLQVGIVVARARSGWCVKSVKSIEAICIIE